MIRNAPDLSPPSPRWRKDAPPSLLCVASNGSVCTVLDSIGPNVDITDEAGEDLSDWLSSGEPLPPGIWVGTLVVNHYETDTYYGREWDMEMDFTDVREATDEEVIHISQGESPWDPSKWIENWTEVQEGTSPLSRMKASLRALPSEDGWLESSGPDSGFPKSRAVPRDLISWVETWLSSALENGLPPPYIYPTFEGAISAEWSGNGKELSLLFRHDRKGDFSCVNVDTADGEEVTLVGLYLNNHEDTSVILRLVTRFLGVL